MLDIYQVFEKLYMQWMGVWIHHHPIFSASVDPDFGFLPKSWLTAAPTTHVIIIMHSFRLVTSPRMNHTSMSDIYRVFDNLYMQWMGVWIHHHPIFSASVDPDFGFRPKSWLTAAPTTHVIIIMH
jgi:hypothetical protein